MRFFALAFAVAAAASLLSLPVVAKDVGGTYSVEGQEPAGGGQYKGEVAVVKEGSTYQVMWLIGNQVAVGTGVLLHDTFAVTYMTRGSNRPGVALYEVGPDGTLTGMFTLLGAKIIGGEYWTPLDR